MNHLLLPRRQFLRSMTAGSMLLPGIVRQLLAADGAAAGPQFPAKARRVIFLFMTGGVSHVDSFDPKPRLLADHGREIKAAHPEIKDRPGYERIKNVDQPIAGLLRDLKARGMLDDTLVLWTTEFGRTPFNNTADAKGREHHNWAFSSRLADAGVRPGIVHGETDEYGLRVAKDGVHVHDFHATILHLMGFDHTKLTFRHSGRDYRLTDVHGDVVKGVLA